MISLDSIKSKKPPKDWTGKRFGKLVALEYTHIGKTSAWKCRCECGNELLVRTGNLVRGNSTSCGCNKREDITGQKFGHLTALKYDTNAKKGRSKWICCCDCGNTVSIQTAGLKNGHSTSCGCMPTFEDVSGKRFGKLVVIERIPGTHPTYWKCLCDCGNTTQVRLEQLKKGKAKSCGCYAKEVARKLLTTHGLSHTKEYKTAARRREKERRKIRSDQLDIEWTVEMEISLKKYYPKCILCGSEEKLCVDHVLPLSRGYGLRPGNAVVLCNKCNSKKNDKLLKDIPTKQRTILETAAKKFDLFWQNNAILHPLDPLNFGWATNDTIFEWRQFLKHTLLQERKYRSDMSGEPLYETCEMHEGIISRNMIPKNIWWQILIFHPFNSFLLTVEQHRPSPPSKDWAVSKAYALYGRDAVRDWFDSLPFKTRPFRLP